jgi:hypothetical protein
MCHHESVAARRSSAHRDTLQVRIAAIRQQHAAFDPRKGRAAA